MSTQGCTNYSNLKLYSLCLFVTACHISIDFTPLAWKAEFREIAFSMEAEFINLICRKMTSSSPSNTPVLASNVLNRIFFREGCCVGPRDFCRV